MQKNVKMTIKNETVDIIMNVNLFPSPNSTQILLESRYIFILDYKQIRAAGDTICTTDKHLLTT